MFRTVRLERIDCAHAVQRFQRKKDDLGSAIVGRLAYFTAHRSMLQLRERGFNVVFIPVYAGT